MGRLRNMMQPSEDEGLDYQARRYTDGIIKTYKLTPDSSDNDIAAAVSNDFEKDRQVLREKVPLVGGFIGKASLWGLDQKSKDVRKRLNTLKSKIPETPASTKPSESDEAKRRYQERLDRMDKTGKMEPLSYEDYLKEFKQ